MTQTLKLKRSAVAGRAPTTSDLELGELAINTTDGKLYIKKSVSGTESIVALSASQAGELQTQQFSGDGSTTAFTLSATPNDENALLVFIGGAYQNKDSYAISGTTLTFDTAPDNGTDVLVHHFRGGLIGTAPAIDTMTGDGSDTTLTLSVSPQSENQTFVTIDGVVQHKDTYSVSGTTLTFASAPSNSAKVECITFRNTVVTTFEDGDGDTMIQVEESSDEDTIRFDTAGSQRLSILSTGVTKIEGTNSLQFNTNGSIKYSSSPSSIIFSNASSEDIHIKTVANASPGEIQFSVNNSETARIVDGAVLIGTNSSLHSSADLQIQGASGNYARIMLKDQDSTNAHAFIDKSGAGLDFISQNGTSHGTIELKTFDGTDTLSRLTVAADGKVGIGTTSPSESLHINGSSSEVALRIDTTNADPKIRLTTLGQQDWSIGVDYSDSGKFKINESGNVGTLTALTIDANRNVGIGTTSPNHTLDIVGTNGVEITTEESTDAIALLDSNNSNTKYFNIQGNSGACDVFVPAGNLNFDVSGDISFDADGADIRFADGGTIYGNLANESGHFAIKAVAQDTDIRFRGDDGGSAITALTLDMSDAGTATFNHDVKLDADNSTLKIGAGLDLQLLHDGTNSIIKNTDTGNLIIRNTVDDGDVILQTDDGSGGVTNYLTLDGSDSRILIPVNMRFSDNINAYFGFSNDLEILHNATDSAITNNTGDLYITNKANDKDIIFRSDDGSGGFTSYFELDGSDVVTKFRKNLYLLDNVALKIGNSFDLDIKHDGSDSYIQNSTGDLYIRNSADDKDIILQCDDGSGGLTPYLTLDGSNERINLHKNLRADDNARLQVGGDGDMSIYHNGTDTLIENATGDLIIQNSLDDKDVILKSDNGSGDVTAYVTLDGSAVTTFFNKNTRHPDSIIATFGSSSDLQIYHDGSHSNIQDTGTGNLRIAGSIVEIAKNDFTETMAKFTEDGASELYHNGSKKFETNSSGVEITGTLTIGTNDIIKEDNNNLKIQSGQGVIINIDNNDSGPDIFAVTEGSSGSTLFQVNQNDNSTSVTGALSVGGGATITGDLTTTGGITVGDSSADALTFFGILKQGGSGGTTVIDASRNLTNINDATVGGNLTVTGNLTVDGTTTTLNTATLDVEDKNITLNKGSGDTSGSADGAGITIQDAVDASNDATILWNASADRFDFSHGLRINADDQVLTVGAGGDFQLSHNGTDTFMANNTGHFYITQNVDDKDLIFRCDDGSGGVAEYFRLDGSDTRIKTSKNLRVADDVYITFGDSDDLQIRHTSNSSSIENFTGNLTIKQTVDDGDIILQSDDGSGGTAEYIRLDGSAVKTLFSKDIRFSDSVKALFGGSDDFKIYHDATDSLLQNETGDLRIVNNADDKDILIQTDDGSGGNTTYMTFDGSHSRITIAKNILLFDNVELRIGDNSGAGDLKIYHNSTHSILENSTGDLILMNNADDKDILMQTDDGSGGVTTYMTFDGSATKVTLQKDLRADDGVKIQAGSSGDLFMVHESDTSKITNGTGNLEITQNVDDGDIIFKSDDGSGGTAEYFKLDGSLTKTFFHKNIQTDDNVKLQFGNGADLALFHDGTDSSITNSTGDLTISNTADDKDIIFKSDDGSGGVATYLTLDGSTTTMAAGKNLTFADNIKAVFGTGSDLEIYHDASHSYVIHGGAGQLVLESTADDIVIRAADDVDIKVQGGETAAKFGGNGGVDLYHNNVKKFSTDANGIVTVGTVNVNSAYTLPTSDGSNGQALVTDGSGTLSFGTVSGGSSTSIADADADTKIQVEESSDEDKIRFDTAGTERVVIDAAGVTSSVPFRKTGTGSAMVVNSLDFVEYSSGFRIGSVADDDESLTLVGFGGQPKIVLDDGTNVTILQGSTECARISSARSLFGTTTATGKFGINTGTSGGVNASAGTQANGSVIFGNTDGSSVSPAIMMKGDGSQCALRSATANGANHDIEFNIRENDDSDFASTGGAGFMFSRYGTDLLQITRNGNVDIGFSSGVGTGDGNPALRATQASDSFNGNLLQLQAKRPSSSAYSLIQAYANFASDAKFKVRGDGEVSADGSFSGGGADYAEYFEWSDGNSSDEDRIGYSVSLVNEKIKIAESGETIIGVTSANPSVTGDSQDLDWQGKYLKDDFGRYVEEDYTATEWIKETSDNSDTPKRERVVYHTDKIPSDVTVPENAVVLTKDENGNNLRRRKLNPSYDESLTYIPRRDRKEWECVGIMGKVKLRKGQQTAASWIKLRKISETVEEWLIK